MGKIYNLCEHSLPTLAEYAIQQAEELGADLAIVAFRKPDDGAIVYHLESDELAALGFLELISAKVLTDWMADNEML